MHLLITHLKVIDNKLLETIWQCVPCLLVSTISNARHEVLTFKSPPHPVVDTLGLPPVALHSRHTSSHSVVVALNLYISLSLTFTFLYLSD